MRTVTLVSLGLGGAGVATGAGFAINNYINKENIKTDETITQSIKERIEQSKKSKNKVFITTQGLNLEDIKKNTKVRVMNQKDLNQKMQMGKQ